MASIIVPASQKGGEDGIRSGILSTQVPGTRESLTKCAMFDIIKFLIVIKVSEKL